ncbi:MAG: hypothetical protein JWP91_2281 [Fibrobacteres bacterium]|nr:hypothetical protein [Fibrobacterota bacterium]
MRYKESSLFLALAAHLCLSGCSVIGGVAGHARDDLETRTRIIDVKDAGSLRKGAMVYLTIPNRETMKGRFSSLTETNGRKYVNLRTPDGEARIGLADVSEIAEDLRDNDKLIKGLLIGGAIDLAIAGGAFWIYHEIQQHTLTE